jgi:hypothetical protein
MDSECGMAPHRLPHGRTALCMSSRKSSLAPGEPPLSRCLGGRRFPPTMGLGRGTRQARHYLCQPTHCAGVGVNPLDPSTLSGCPDLQKSASQRPFLKDSSNDVVP